MNSVIIGLGFGDEGKGIVADYLCSQSPESLVVRFSGGHQAGHTVVSDDFRHVFSNFGSGTFRGIPTYWSKFCTVEPIGLLKELSLLKERGLNPIIYIDERCPITTPYDIYNNQTEEEKNYHGSCGVGFGSTINREENFYSLTFLDLFYPDVFEAKLDAIYKFYSGSLYTSSFVEACKILVNCENIKRTFDLPHYENYIFEGSQGLLLDQHFGFFPHVTRSNTGCKNAVEVRGHDNFDIFLVTRAYQTRHGNGFMTNEHTPHDIKENPNETNVTNKYQGCFRKSLLDLSLLEYVINKDEYIKQSNRKNLVITCLDHITNYRFTYKREIIDCYKENDFVGKISEILGIKNVYLSRSDDSKNIKKWQAVSVA